jgi:hypothetical protein
LEQALALNQQSAISGRENSRHARKRGYAEREKEKLMDIIRNSRNQEWKKEKYAEPLLQRKSE